MDRLEKGQVEPNSVLEFYKEKQPSNYHNIKILQFYEDNLDQITVEHF